MRANLLAVTVLAVSLAGGAAQAAESSATTSELAGRVCATCHGPTGNSIAPTFPRLAGQQAEYLDVQIRAFRDQSRADPHAQAYMWGMASKLTDQTIKELAEFYSSQTPVAGTHSNDPEVAAGEKIFREGVEAQEVPACQTCHGEKAEGNSAIPRLAGQHRGYLEKQLEAFAANLRANEIMHNNSKNLTALQISQVAAFLSAQ